MKLNLMTLTSPPHARIGWHASSNLFQKNKFQKTNASSKVSKFIPKNVHLAIYLLFIRKKIRNGNS